MTLFYFYVLNFFYKIRNIDWELKIITVFISFLILQLVRIYAQSFFPDIPNYSAMFNQIPSLNLVLLNDYGLEYYEDSEELGGLSIVPVELGFLILISAFKVISNNFFLFLLFISTLQLSVFYIFCKRFSIPVLTAFMVYIGLTFMTFQIGMLRQSLAFCFFLLALVHGKNKSVYFFLIFVGFFFHRSILFCLIFAFARIRINRILILLIAIFSLGIYIFEIDLISKILSYFKAFDSIPFTRFDFYLNVDRPNNYLGVGFWERLFLLIAIYYVFDDLVKRGLNTVRSNIFFNLSFCLIIMQLLFFSSPTITSRLRYFIVIFPLLFLYDYIKLLKDRNLVNLLQFIFFLYLSLQVYLLTAYLREGSMLD